jgi:hypothetical protein
VLTMLGVKGSQVQILSARPSSRVAELGVYPAQRPFSLPAHLSHLLSDDSESGTTWGPAGRQVGAQRGSGRVDELPIRVQVALGGGQ